MNVLRPCSVPQVPRPLVLLTLLSLLLPLLVPAHWVTAPDAPPAAPAASDAAATLAQLPLAFVPNAGQTDPAVRFEARALGGTLFFTPAAVVLALPTATPAEGHDDRQKRRADRQAVSEASSTTTIQVRFAGANPEPTIVGVDPLPGVVNYLLGNDPSRWRTNVPTSAGIVYQQLYPGIDLRYDGQADRLKGTYLLSAGADPSRIRWRYEGASDVRLDTATGDLQITLAASSGATAPTTLVEHAPVAWQTLAGQHVPVDARYVVGADGSLGFALGAYDVSAPLILDPTLDYSTYLGGSKGEVGRGIAVDSAGNSYLTGQTGSSDFPTATPYQSTNQDTDAFVTKLSAGGTTLLWSTYLGGVGDDYGWGIAVDSVGTTYLTGYTDSHNFPTTANAGQRTNGGSRDAFIAKLSAAGTQLKYSTYFGGTGLDRGYGIAVDSVGTTYLTGETQSTNFPIENALDRVYNGAGDVFVAKLGTSGDGLYFSTYLGGTGLDIGIGIAVDSAGTTYLTGETQSIDFPNGNAYQRTFQGEYDAFVAKLSTSGTLLWSTYLGGTGFDNGIGIAVDSAGTTYLTGETQSTNFPTVEALYSFNQGAGDAFVAKLSTSGTLLWSTYLGGTSFDQGYGIAVDGAGNTYLTGQTQSTNFPTENPLQPTNRGNNDAFIAKLSASGALYFSTYLGGTGDDSSRGIAVDSAGNTYLTGWTSSSDFPTANALQPSRGSYSDVFVVKIATGPRLHLSASATPPHLSYCPTAPCDTVLATLTLTATDGTVPATLTATLPAGLNYLPDTATGGAAYDAPTRQIRFAGPVAPDAPTRITFQARLVPGTAPGAILTTEVVATDGVQTIQHSMPVAVQDNDFGGTLVLLYGSGDNDLAGEMLELAAKAEQGAAKPNVAALLLLDGPGSEDAALYRLQPAQPGQTCPMRYLDRTCGGRYQDGHTVWPWAGDNLGDPTTLTAFVVAARTAYPKARQVVLSLIGHGGGWSPPVLAGQPSGHKVQPGGDRLGGMLWDDHPGTTISTPALGRALRASVAATGGRPIDLVFLDACQMAMAEVAYELRDSATYLLASPNWKWAAFPYDQHLKSITTTMTTEELSRAWFANEARAVEDWDEPYTYTLLRLRAADGAAGHPIDTLRAAVDALGQALMPYTTGTGRAGLLAAFTAADRYDSNQDGALAPADNYVDILSFARHLQAQFSDTPAVMEAAGQVMAATEAVILLDAQHSGSPSIFPDRTWRWSNAGGLSIYLPLQPDDWRRRYYDRLTWTKASPSWLSFLTTWWNTAPSQGLIPGDPTCPTGGCSLPPTSLPRSRQYLPIAGR